MRDLEALHAELRAALLAGENTAVIRQAIAAAEAEQRATAEHRAQEVAERDAAEADRICSTAEAIAADAAERLTATMALLQPPAMPVGLHSTR